MHAVSSGLVFLALLPAAIRDAYLGRDLETFTARTLTDPDALRERLARVQADGYAWVHEEFAEGLNSVAAAVADASGEHRRRDPRPRPRVPIPRVGPGGGGRRGRPRGRDASLRAPAPNRLTRPDRRSDRAGPLQSSGWMPQS